MEEADGGKVGLDGAGGLALRLQIEDIAHQMLASVDKGMHNKTTKYGLPTY